MEDIRFRVIGLVKNGIQEETSKDQWQEAISEIVIEPKFAEDLIGIEIYRYIAVLFWMDKIPARDHKRSLATCFPQRPNPIGLTFVELLSRERNVLKVRGLDAFDGTPVLDIKPYKPWSFKRIRERLPDINTERLDGNT